MAGVISPSMPLWVVQERSTGRRSFSNLNEGLGSVLRFGANNEAVLNRLAWMRDELGPVLAYALAHRPEGLALGPLMAQALHMGDEVHNRNVAATGLFLRQLLPAMLDGDLSQAALQRVVAFIGANDHFFLNVSMAACHAMLQAAANIPNSTMVTVMARNGINFGIRFPEPAAAGSRPPPMWWRDFSFLATPRLTRPPIWATAPSPKRQGWAVFVWLPRPPSPASWAAHPPMRWRRAARCTVWPWPPTLVSPCRRWISPPPLPASTSAGCSTAGSCR